MTCIKLDVFRPAVVTCVGTEESEVVDRGYANSFIRSPTVGRFRVTSGMSKLHPTIKVYS